VSDTLPFSAACERNKDVILEKLNPYLTTLDSILEVGSGTAQHAVHFAKAHQHLKWQTSDQSMYLDGIHTQLKYAGVDNVLSPLTLDVNQAVWDQSAKQYPAVYTANTLHIMAQSDVEAFFAGLTKVLSAQGLLFIYGPFKYNGEFTSPSNLAFDQSLRARECGSAIRDFELIEKLANDVGLFLVQDHKMPANNQLLIFQRGG